MAVSTSTPSAAELLDQLDRLQLRDDVNWRQAATDPSGSATDAAGLARSFVKSGWLTPYQANQLILGRGQALRLGGYVLLDKIGEGGMGAVFAARHLLMRRTVALKLIRNELLAYPEARLRFLREVELLARLSHPHIVTAHDAEQVGDCLYLVMEFCEGTNLASLVRERGPLPVAMACACAEQAALGLQHAMEHGLVHRDIKPGNLLVTAGGLKVLDLGLARLGQPSSSGAALTEAGTFLGTPDFVAPEQARNSLTADIRSDLYSLGCTLYFSLTGTVPFPGGTVMEKVLRHQSEEPVSLRQLRPEVPREVADIVRRLMSKQPGDRYQTPQEVVEALKPWAKWDASLGRPQTACAPAVLPTLAHAPSTRFPSGPATVGETAVRETVPPIASRWRHRRRWLIGAGLGASIAVILALLQSGPPPSSPSDDKPITIQVKLPDKWRMIRELPQPAFVNHVAFSPNRKTLAVTYWPTGGKIDRQILLWDIAEGMETNRLAQEPAPAVGAIAFSPDGKYFASGAGDLNRDLYGTVVLWDAVTWEQRFSFRGGSRGILALTFSADSKRLAVGDRTGRVTLWDITAGEPEKPIKELLGHDSAVNAILFLPDGQTLATASGDRTVRLWDLGSKKVETLPPGRLPGLGFGLAFFPETRTLACVTQTPPDDPPAEDESLGAIFLWDLENRQLKRPPIRDPYRMSCVKFSPDGKYLIVGKMNDCSVLDVRTGEPVRQLEKPMNYVTGLSLTTDGGLLAIGIQDDRLVRLWQLH